MSESENLKAWSGRHVSLELVYADGERERMELDIVPDSAADFERGFLGDGTPLARAIIGHGAGSQIAYRQGDIVQVTVLAVVAQLSSAPVDREAEREEKLRKAAADADRTSLMIYATAANNKWGDTDPSALGFEAEELNNEDTKDTRENPEK